MNTSSYFIKDKALFGGYPNNDNIEYFENIGVEYFVNLTSDKDNIKPYHTTKTCINFPIQDRKTPDSIRRFSSFLLHLLKLIKESKSTEKFYIHCKGGHGRAGIVVACLLTMYENISTGDALKLTKLYHSKRIEMKDRWRSIGSPQTYSQKKFVHDLFNPIVFTNVSNGFKSGLSNLSNHSVIIDGIVYENAELAYHCLQMNTTHNKNINTKNIYYIRKHYESKYYTNHNQKVQLMEKIIRQKYQQNYDTRENLLNIGLRKIVYNSQRDTFWGSNKDIGDNNLGVILTKIKNEYLLQLY
jgi:predicted NAD-dependent protein-ADP-ribosyltransferase YbiA (DUF1768 family)